MARHLPRFEDNRNIKTSWMIQGQEVISKLVERIKEVLLEHEKAGQLKWPPHRFVEYKPSSTLTLDVQLAAYLQGGARRTAAALPTHLRPWLTLRAGRPCTRRTLSPSGELGAEELEALASLGGARGRHCPLDVALIALDTTVRTQTRKQRGQPELLGTLPFGLDLSRHPAARSELAAAMIRRLDEDVQKFAAVENRKSLAVLAGFTSDQIQQCVGSPAATGKLLQIANSLIERLTALHRRDYERFAELVAAAVRKANVLPAHSTAAAAGSVAASLDTERRAAFELARLSGREASVNFDHLVGMLLSNRAESDLQLFNPHASLEQLRLALELTSVALLTATRIGQAQRCIVEARELLEIVRQLPAQGGRRSSISHEGLARAAEAKAQMLASSLTAQRHYVQNVSGMQPGAAQELIQLGERPSTRGPVEFDPRLLVFEFTHDLLLREAQVSLIQTFIEAHRRGESLCHQLIMGQGKTTVIAPLLALMIADGTSLVLSIVPPHLLPSARAVLREKLAAALQRPVYGMTFDRYTEVTRSLLELLRHASALRGVLLLEPSAVKSVMLKFVDALVELQGEVEAPTPPPPEEVAFVHRLQRLLGLRQRKRKHAFRSRRSELRVTADTLAAVLGEFRRSVALLDEVDVLLHPLRSELNWPQGERQPIHFAPMRWQLPFHLLDGALYPASHQCTATWHESPEAQLLLQQLCDVYDSGLAGCALQAVPHTTLLERSFYDEQLRPLLTKWALLWLRRNRVQHGSDDHIISYLSRGAQRGGAPSADASEPLPSAAADPLRAQAQAQAAAAAQAKFEAAAAEAAAADAQKWQWLVSRLSSEQMQLLNLAYTWLHTVLPHVLCKVARVHYGLLPERMIAEMTAGASTAPVGPPSGTAAAPGAPPAPLGRAPSAKEAGDRAGAGSFEDLAAAAATPAAGGGSGSVPQSRRLLAVPFVGKDVPSLAAEFSHPDALIGLTILAYRHEGLRRADFVGLINLLLEQMGIEGGPYRYRPTCRLYAQWVRLAGGAVRGMGDVLDNAAVAVGLGERLDLTGRERREARRSHDEPAGVTVPGLPMAKSPYPPTPLFPGDVPAGATSVEGGGASGTMLDLWPLQLLNPLDAEQMNILYELLGRLPHAVQHYLENLAFPLTMQHQALKLSANGQDLGSASLFGCRLGFSGTPSDLLPTDLGRCIYQEGDDAQMLSILTTTSVMSYTFVEHDWSVIALLDSVASHVPPFHALIDSGALITGLTNLQVARYLLTHGLEGMEGVVFLDDKDRKVILLRAGLRVLPLAGCGVAPHRRFTFFDQVHSTGVDVAQTLSAQAAMTLGKDMTFRDFAQGAFRMRAVGAGQTITLLITPQVAHLVRVEVARMRGVPLHEQRPLREASHESLLRIVCAWLVVNLMRSEDVQAGLLAEQRLAHVFRKRALGHLLAHHRRCGTHDERTQETQAVRVFLEPLGHDVPADVPAPARPGERALKMADQHRRLLSGGEDADERDRMERLYAEVSGLARRGAGSAAGSGGGGGGVVLPFEAEVVQEQEQEEEAEEEQEQEQEQEQEKSQEQEQMVMQEPGKLYFSREDESLRPWPLHHLGEPPQPDGGSASGSTLTDLLTGSVGGAGPFYPWSKFAVYRSGSAKARPLQWPARLWMSSNYFKSQWSLKSHRRLKNVICAMEWQPPPLGLRWVRLPAKPAGTRLVEYEQLGRALAGGKLRFTRHELEALGAMNLLSEDVVEADGAYFQPEGGRRLAHASEMMGGVSLTETQCARVKSAFSHLDEDGDGMLSASELATLGRAVDLEEVAKVAEEAEKHARLRGEADPGAMPSAGFLPMVMDQLRSHAEGPGSRYWVLLSLAEAESLRGALHVRQEQESRARSGEPLAPTAAASPRDARDNARDKPTAAAAATPPSAGWLSELSDGLPDGALVALHSHAELLDAVHYSAGGAYEREVVRQCFRFFSSEMQYTPREQHLLLRCLHTSEPKARQTFFQEVRECRRRAQGGWERSEVAAVLSEPDEFALFEHRALLAATQRRVSARGLSLRQAFHAFNSSRTGSMNSSELFSALVWLGLQPTVALVHATVRRLDGDADGLLTCDEFVAGFAAGDPTADTSGSAMMVPGQQELVIPLQRIPELHASAERQSMPSGSSSARAPIVSFSSAELAQFAASLTVCEPGAAIVRPTTTGRAPTVTDLGTGAADAAAAAAASPLTIVPAALARGKYIVPIGHYVGAEGPPSLMRTIELRDKRGTMTSDASVRLQAALDQVMPPPARFQLMWSRAGPASLSIWAAVPPTQDFVAVGMIATATANTVRPAPDALRCVPKAWTRRTTATELVHEGSEGSIWRSESTGLLHASKGRNPPAVYELVSEEFGLGG